MEAPRSAGRCLRVGYGRRHEDPARRSALPAQPNRPDRRLEREAQADAIRSIVLEKRCPGCEVIVLGDFNDYDGASDALDHVNSAPITNVLLALKRLDPADSGDDLVNAAVFVPKGERFTSFFDQDEDMQIDRPHEPTSTDHVLMSQGLADQLDTVDIDHDLNPALGTDGFVSDHFPCGCRCCSRTRQATRIRRRRPRSPTTVPSR